MKLDTEKYKRLFLTEAKEHLENISRILENSRTNLAEEEINSLFREAHSLKGMAAAMGYQSISELAHSIENLMDAIRQGKEDFRDEMRELLLSSNDVLWTAVEDIEAGREIIPLDEYITRLNTWKSAGIEKHESSQNKEMMHISIIFNDNVPSIQARAYLIYKNIESFGKIAGCQPSLDDIKQGGFKGQITIGFVPAKPINELKTYLSTVSEIKKVEYTVADASKADPHDHLTEKEDRDRKHDERLVLPQSIKVDTNMLDYFVNITGELLTIKSHIREATKELEDIEISKTLNQMEILLKDLQNKVMRVRLTPLDIILSRIPRWIRDLSAKLHKKVDVSIEGEGIKLDRTVVEALFDPMLHIIRNAIDHGIEAPAERIRKGKNEKGRITIKACKEKETVIVEIMDDGMGINADKVYEAAQKSGKYSQDTLEGMKAKKDKLFLVTTPGISTKDEVTDISGRGVGLDVVKSVLESFGGTLEIDSSLGVGTRISLRLPISISIVNVLFFKLGHYVFGTPADKIIRIVLADKKDQIILGEGSTVIFYENDYIPLVSLRTRLDMVERSASDMRSIIIVKIKGALTGILVDDFIGHKEVYLRHLNQPLSLIPGFYSSAIMGDGTPILILDLQGMF